MKYSIGLLFISALLFGCVKEDHTHDHTHDDNTTGSNSITVDWFLEDLGDGEGYYSSNITWPAITSDIVDNGAVLLYMTSSDWTNPEWVALPYSLVYGLDYFSTVSYSFSAGNVFIQWLDSDYLTPDYPNYDTFRVVVFEDRSTITDESILELIEKYEEIKIVL
jgi:hypothetical protein